MPPAAPSRSARTSRSAASSRSGKPSANSRPWHEPTLAPVLLVRGPEGLLAERAVDGVVRLARERDPETEKTELDGSLYAGGQLAVAASPSLFGEPSVVVVRAAEAATEDLVADVVAYVAAPDPETVVVVVHGGGQRGKKMLDAILASGAPVLECDAISKDADKVQFVGAEFRAARRRADADAVRSLVDALGTDLRELASACAQLVADTSGTISTAVVDRYYGGRVEATGFKVADAAVAGDAGGAVALLRHALATGADPVPIVAALALRLRTLARVAAIRGGSVTARQLGLQDWQVRNAQRDLSRWTPEGLAEAITAVAQADADVKGGGRDPVYAVERAVLTIAASRRR
ncbi:DNA polymerase III subunit delta [Isoptericola sp. NEAU-Y5]|uniref:DNA-directed DNA polymerase n=1 Tax=Isoptericola luteus TaxID=2879484 RepID=A0ABS7ZIL9_9MICO|nr:DNA polymerase III subunit delta [Isoptericola sp. NEAU-Y5]MCA5894871.1 DNA polymerase III subunit delta [Isoptericola sp. NEAU-Y5]